MPERIGLIALFEDKDFRKGIENYTKKVEQATKDTDKAAGQITKDTEKIGRSWQSAAQDMGLASTIMVAALAAVLTKVTLTAARTAELGIVVTRVGQNIGKSAEEMDAYVEGIKSMGITTQAARQSTIQMVQAQIDLSYATDLARLAQDAAVIAQLDSSQAFERLVTVIQRGSPLMARTMGIIVDFQAAYKQMAEELGKTTGELTKQEKVHARVQNVLENSAQISGTYTAAMGSAGKQMRSMSRYVEELSNAMGDSLMPVMGAAVKSATDLLKWGLDVDPVLRNTAVQTLAVATAILAIGKAATMTIPKLIAMVVSLGPLGIAGAFATAAAAMFIYGRQMEDAHIAEAASIADAAESYEEYLVQLDKAERGSWALSEGLYEVSKGADAAAKGMDALALSKAWDELRAGFGFDTFGVEWLDDLLESLPRLTADMDMLTKGMKAQAKEADAAALAVMADAEMVRHLGKEQGYTGEVLEQFVEILTRVAQQEIAAREQAEKFAGAIFFLKDPVEAGTGVLLDFAEAAREVSVAISDAAMRASQIDITGAQIAIQARHKQLKEEVKATEQAMKDRERAQEQALRQMQQNEESYAGALAQLYDQIINTDQRAQDARLQAERDYARAAIALEEDLARQREDIMQRLDQALEDNRRKAHQDRLDAARDLTRDLVDLETDLAEDNEKTWKSYYASLESLAEQHGQKLASITEKYAKQRASIEDKYRTEPTRGEEIESERERLQRELEDLGRPRGFMERQQQQEILAALEALKQEELAILLAAQEEEVAAEEAAYQEQKTKAAERREEQLTANQEQFDKEAEQRQLAYDRELEDLRISLDRQQEERRLATQRALDDLKEQAALQRAELAAGHQERLNEIERGLSAETQAFKDAYNNQLSDLQTYLNQRTQHWRDHQAAIEGILGISSPSKWMESIGKEMRAGLDSGFAAPNLATDLQSAVANFGKASSDLALPAASGGGSTTTNTTHNHNLDFTANYQEVQSEASVKEDLWRADTMLSMRAS